MFEQVRHLQLTRPMVRVKRHQALTAKSSSTRLATVTSSKVYHMEKFITIPLPREYVKDKVIKVAYATQY